MWIEILSFLFLAICAVHDGIRKEIPLIVVWVGMIVAITLRIRVSMDFETWRFMALSVVPGMMFWVLSFVTREKVGYGDGWMLVMIGLFVGLQECLLILLAGLIVESIAGLTLLAFHRITKDREIPFAPYLLLGMGVVICF